jgi:predicted GIY-YIG superfamily endonuclease
MKECIKCNTTKPYSEFNKRKDSKDGFRNDCSECLNERTKNNYHNNVESISKRRKELHKLQKHKPLVYLLKKEQYVGVTENIKKRMNRHSSCGRLVDDVVVLMDFKSRTEALELECFLHELGYKGKHRG